MITFHTLLKSKIEKQLTKNECIILKTLSFVLKKMLRKGI